MVIGPIFYIVHQVAIHNRIYLYHIGSFANLTMCIFYSLSLIIYIYHCFDLKSFMLSERPGSNQDCCHVSATRTTVPGP